MESIELIATIIALIALIITIVGVVVKFNNKFTALKQQVETNQQKLDNLIKILGQGTS